MRRIIHGVDRAVDAALFLAFLLLFLIGAYSVYDTLLVFGQAQDASVLRYKPQTVSTQQEQDERQRPPQFLHARLHSANSMVSGLLRRWCL